MQKIILPRDIQKNLIKYLKNFPAVAIIGPRQSGKSTLASMILQKFKKSVILDLERDSDLQKLSEPEFFFRANAGKLICIDEIQRQPQLFPLLRSIIDENNRNGQFLILGSASEVLLKQSSESLAGRIIYTELTPFRFTEIRASKDDVLKKINKYWLRGGFPLSYLARTNDLAFVWLDNFIRTFLERDIPQLGFSFSSAIIKRLWKMCAHLHGQLLNYSSLGNALGVSHTTARTYIDLLANTFMIRLLPPVTANLKKRLVKSPKIYIRDTGILHALLNVDSFNELLGHPVYGFSWEGLVIENIISKLPDWQASFYRTSTGSEIDLILQKGKKKIAIEVKASAAPNISKSFWNAIDAIEIQKACIISLVRESYQLNKKVRVCSLPDFLQTLKL